MILDSSALVAVLRDEPEAGVLLEIIDQAPHCRLSAANYIETAVVIDSSRDPIASRRLDDFLQQAEVEIQAVTKSQARIAREAYRDFGKGSGHPARLNLGDCFAYALAKESGEPLLFKGDDFSRTDVACASSSK